MSMADTNVRYFRLFDLHPDESLSEVFGAFRKGHRVTREKLPPTSGIGHVCTGVRGVYMEAKTNIPLTIDVIFKSRPIRI